MTKPHKYADIIKAWADGAEIQVRDPEFSNPTWTDCNPNNPGWHLVGVEFRIKPNNVVRYAPIFKTTKGGIVVGHGVTQENRAYGQVRDDFDLLNIIRVEVDDEGNLVSCYTVSI